MEECGPAPARLTCDCSSAPGDLAHQWKALQLEWNNNEEDAPSGLEVPLKLIQPVPCVKIASMKRKRQVDVIEDPV